MLLTPERVAKAEAFGMVKVGNTEWLFLKALPYWMAGLGGALIAALWNFFMTASFTWGGSTAKKARTADSLCGDYPVAGRDSVTCRTGPAPGSCARPEPACQWSGPP